MPDALLKINGHRSRDHMSLALSSDNVSSVLTEEQEARTPTVSDDSGVDDKMSVCTVKFYYYHYRSMAII